jgi:hypothetical protein
MDAADWLSNLVDRDPKNVGGYYESDDGGYTLLVVVGTGWKPPADMPHGQVSIKPARFSWAELHQFWERVHSDHIAGSIPFRVNGYYIADARNRVIVWLDELRDETVEYFLDRYGDIVELEQHDPLDELSSPDPFHHDQDRNRPR